MSLLVPPRLDAPELLDEHDAPREDVERSLRDLRRINRWLGGIRIYRALIRRHAPQARSVLDLGTGSSDLLGSVRDRLDGRRVGLDFKIDHLLYGRAIAPGDALPVAGNAFQLPLRDRSVDVVTSSHFFHHFTPEENVAVLKEALRVARMAVIVNDTTRNRIPYLFVRFLAALGLVGRITREDAPASVLRGYTVPEARAVAMATRAHRWRVERLVPFRFGLILWK
jgi:predicted nicotinamide N-methyase